MKLKSKFQMAIMGGLIMGNLACTEKAFLKDSITIKADKNYSTYGAFSKGYSSSRN